MKILLVAPKDHTVLGMISAYCKDALTSLGHEVHIFDFRQHPYSQGKISSRVKSAFRRMFPSLPTPYSIPAVKSLTDKKINGLLLDAVSILRPEIVLVFCGENIFAETITEIKNRFGSTTVNWFHDSLLYRARQDLIRFVLPSYDYLFIVDSREVLKRIDLGARNVFSLPLACDPKIHNRMALSGDESARYGSDVVFVGTMTPDREKILEALSDFDLKIWGRWERKSEKLRGCYQREIYGVEAAKVYNASKIVIDIHTFFLKESSIYNVTPRLFEVPACGGFLLANDIPQVSQLYRVGSEIVTYKDVSDLQAKIKYYLARPEERKKIATAGSVRAHSEHTYAQRLEKLLDIVSDRRQ